MTFNELIDYLYSLVPHETGHIAIEGGLIEGCDQLVTEGILYEAYLQPKMSMMLPGDRPRKHYQWTTKGYRYAVQRNTPGA